MSEDQENLVEEEPKASAPEDNVASVETTKEEKPVKKEETAADLLGANIEQVKVRKAKGSKNISSGICYIVATFNNTKVSFTDMKGKGRLTVDAGRSNFSLATLPKEDFPVMASSEYDSNFSAPAPVLRRLFDKSKFAISTEETRYYLNGVYMHIADADGGQVLRCVATDGHRLARIDADLPDGASDMPGIIVPRKTVGELRKLLEDDDVQIAVSVSETKVRFATPEITLTSKVIDGTFPDYQRVIPAGNTRRLEVDASEFAKAVDRVSTVSSERSRAVKLSLDEDRLVLSVNSPESGAAEEELAVAYGDERLEIGFNAKYLLEIASQVDRENAVFMFNSSGDPTLMREGNDTTAVYVVMPMRV